jgi:sugar lactone lactonase YvrE
VGKTTCGTVIGAFMPGDTLGAGIATSAQMRWPQNVAVDQRDGTLYILDQGNLRVLRVDRPGPSQFPGTISRVAGASNASSGGPLAIQLLNPRGVAVGPDGSVYIAESDRSVVRRVNANGDNVQTIAGTGAYGPGCPDGSVATQCPLVLPVGVAVAADGTVYIADRGDHRVRKVTTDGLITSIAGVSGIASYQGSPNVNPNGQLGIKEPLNYPSGVAVAPDGSVYIADTVNDKIRKVDTSGLIWDVAGTGVRSYSGDGGNPMNAELNNPSDVAVGPDGTVYFADQGNDRIRRIKGGVIDTVAGIGDPNATVPTRGAGGDGGPATAAQLNTPDGVGIGPDGSIFIADRGNNKIRRVTPDGKISTAAGTGTAGDSGDGGLATAATLRGPRSVAVDANGVVYIADSQTSATSIADTGPGRIRIFKP